MGDTVDNLSSDAGKENAGFSVSVVEYMLTPIFHNGRSYDQRCTEEE